MCVVIGALAHDLGHGPFRLIHNVNCMKNICISYNFSHMFEKFIRKVRPNVSWSHETASIDIFQRIVDQLGEVFMRYGLDGDDIIFIKVFTTLIC